MLGRPRQAGSLSSGRRDSAEHGQRALLREFYGVSCETRSTDRRPPYKSFYALFTTTLGAGLLVTSSRYNGGPHWRVSDFMVLLLFLSASVAAFLFNIGTEP